MPDHQHPHHREAGNDDAPGEAAGILIDSLRSTALVRPPTTNGPAWEQDLATANDRAAARSRRRLSDRVPDLDALLTAHHGRAPAAASTSGLLTDLELDGLFDRLLVDADADPGRLRVGWPDGTETLGDELDLQQPGYGFTTLVHSSLVDRLREGASLAVLAAEERAPRLREHLEDWDRILGASARADALLVGPRGRRRWQPDDATRLAVPIAGQARLTSEAGTIDLARGAGAYVPPGTEAAVEAGNDPLEMVVLVLPRITTRHLAQLAANEALYWPILRGDLPHDRSPGAAISFGGSVFDGVDHFARALEQAVDDGALTRVVSRALAGLPGRFTGSLTRAVHLFATDDDDVTVRCPLPGGIHVLDDGRAPDDRISLAAGGKQLGVPVEGVRLLARVADGDDHRLADLITSSPPGVPVADLVRGLATASILEVR